MVHGSSEDANVMGGALKPKLAPPTTEQRKQWLASINDNQLLTNRLCVDLSRETLTSMGIDPSPVTADLVLWDAEIKRRGLKPLPHDHFQSKTPPRRGIPPEDSASE
jgi:hypothetical protein